MECSIELAKCGLLLGTHYEIIEKCLINFDNQQLTAVARVCRAWNKVAKKIIKQRRRPLTVVSKVEVKQDFAESLQVALKKSFEHARGHSLSLCFLMAEESCSEQDFSGLRKLLSPLCRGLVIPGDGIVGTNTDGSISAFISRALKTKFYVGISGILLPEVPDVKIYTFTDAPQWGSLNGENFHSWDSVADQDGKTGRFIDIVSDDEVIKCAAFSTFTSADAGHSIYNFITERQDEPFAFGGYMANQGTSFSLIDTKDCERKRSDACGFFITGKNVVAASVVIKTQREKDIKECFEKLKGCNLPEKNTVCLLFGCVGRNKIKREVEIYHEMFPNIPLAGCTGYGEFGTDHLPDLNAGSQKFATKKARLEVNVGFGYSSIYVAIHSKI